MRRSGSRGLMTVAAVAGLGLPLSACAPSRGDEAAPRPAGDNVTAEPAALAAAESNLGARMIAAGGAVSAVPAATTERMIVRTAELTLQVADVKAVMEQVAHATSASGGFLGASRLWREGASDLASMTVRVPAARLDETLVKFRDLAVRVDNASVTGEDVTRQAVDLNAQLVNLRATETELRALLVTVRQRTQKASDVLEVHAELSRVRGEIEHRTAEVQNLMQLAALSTITITLRPDAVATPIASGAWQPRGVLRDASRALVATAQVTVSAAIWAVVYGGPLLFGAAGAALLLRRLLRGRRPSLAG